MAAGVTPVARAHAPRGARASTVLHSSATAGEARCAIGERRTHVATLLLVHHRSTVAVPDSRRGRTPGALACRALASGSPRRSRAGAPHSQTIGARPTRACRFDSMHGRCLVRASVLLSALSAAIDVVRILFVCGALHARASGRLPPPGRLIRFGGLWLSRRRGGRRVRGRESAQRWACVRSLRRAARQWRRPRRGPVR